MPVGGKLMPFDLVNSNLLSGSLIRLHCCFFVIFWEGPFIWISCNNSVHLFWCDMICYILACPRYFGLFSQKSTQCVIRFIYLCIYLLFLHIIHSVSLGYYFCHSRHWHPSYFSQDMTPSLAPLYIPAQFPWQVWVGSQFLESLWVYSASTCLVLVKLWPEVWGQLGWARVLAGTWWELMGLDALSPILRLYWCFSPLTGSMTSEYRVYISLLCRYYTKWLVL